MRSAFQSALSAGLGLLAAPAVAAWGQKAAPPPPPPPSPLLFELLAKAGVPEASMMPLLVGVGTMFALMLLLVLQGGGGPGGGGGLALLKSFLGQESKRGINVNDWIGDYNALVRCAHRASSRASPQAVVASRPRHPFAVRPRRARLLRSITTVRTTRTTRRASTNATRCTPRW